MLLYITIDSHFTGIGRYSGNLSKQMGYDILQVAFNNKFNDYDYSLQIRGKFKSTFLNYIDYFHYRSFLNNLTGKYKIFHVTSQTVDPFIIPKGIKKVVTIHDIVPFKIKDKKDYKYGIGMRFFLKKYIQYNNIITISYHVKNDILNRFKIDENKITVINPMVSDSLFRINDKISLKKELNLPLDKKLVLSISSNDKRKNIPTVENVMNKINDDYQLVRVGPRIGKSITFENIDDEKLNKIYNACDLLYFPTLEEGFGYPVIEAFKTGLPVVSSNIDVIKEISRDSAYLINPMDINESLEGIYNVYENSSYYIKKGLETSKYYSPEYLKPKLLEFYSRMLE